MLSSQTVTQLLSLTPHLQQFPTGRLIYVLVQKQSNTKMFNNSRLLVFNGKTKMIGYTETIPKSIPLPNIDSIQGIKKQCFFDSTSITKVKNKDKAIEIKSKKHVYKGKTIEKQESWVFECKTPRCADETYLLFNKCMYEILNKPMPLYIVIPREQEKPVEVEKRSPFEASQTEIKKEPSPEKVETKVEPIPSLVYKQKYHNPPLPSIVEEDSPRNLKIDEFPPSHQKPLSGIRQNQNSQNSLRQSREQPSMNGFRYTHNNIKPATFDNYQVQEEEYEVNRISRNSAGKYSYGGRGDQSNPPHIGSSQQSNIRISLDSSPGKSIQNSPDPSNPQEPNIATTHLLIHSKNSNFNGNEKEKEDEFYIPPYVPSRKLQNQDHQQQLTHPSSGKQVTESRVSISNSNDNLSKQQNQPIENPLKPSRNKYDSFRSQIYDSSNKIPDQEIIHTVNYLPNHSKVPTTTNDFFKGASPSYPKIKINPSTSNLNNIRQDSRDSETNLEIKMKNQSSSINWNRQLYFSPNAYKTVNEFKEASTTLVKSIIDSFTTTISSSQHRYTPTTVGQTSTIYSEKNMLIVLAFSLHHDSDTAETEQNLRRQHAAYHYLISYMKQKDELRIPLTSLIQYKGITAMVKAIVGGDEKEYPKQKMTKQLDRMELLTGVSKEIIINNCNFKLVDYYQYNGKHVVFIDDIFSLFPIDDLDHLATTMYVTPELLKNYRQDIENKHPSIHELVRYRNEKQDEFLKEILNFDIIILGSGDLKQEFKKWGFSQDCVSHFYRKAREGFVKSICASEMAAIIGADFLSYHFRNQIKTHAVKNPSLHYSKTTSSANNSTGGNFDKNLIKFANQYINDICSWNANSEELWESIITEIQKQFITKISISDINWGYFLGALLSKVNLKYNILLLDKMKQFNQEPNCISTHFIEGWNCKFSICELNSYNEMAKIRNILSREWNENQSKILKTLLTKIELLNYIDNHSMYEQIVTYSANFTSYDTTTTTTEPSILNISQYPSEPTTLTYMRLQLFKLKHLLKNKNQEHAISILEHACKLINYWGGEFHPLLSDFYDLFSAYYLLIDNQDESLILAKSSLINVIKLIGTSNVITGQKYYQLANIYYLLEKREDSLNHYIKAKDILKSKGLINSDKFGFIEFRISSLYLHFGKLANAEESATHALNIFETEASQQLMDCFELLARIYELSNSLQKLKQNALLCSIRFNNCQDIQLFSRMIRLAIHPFLIDLPKGNKFKLLEVIEKIEGNEESHRGKNRKYYENHLLLRAGKQNLINFFVQMLSKTDLYLNQLKSYQQRKERGYQVRPKPENKSEEFLGVLEAVVVVAEPSFFIGILRDYEY